MWLFMILCAAKEHKQNTYYRTKYLQEFLTENIIRKEIKISHNQNSSIKAVLVLNCLTLKNKTQL